MPTELDTAILARVRAARPGWEITSTEGNAWQAVRTPGPTSEQTIVRCSLAELDERLGELAKLETPAAALAGR